MNQQQLRGLLFMPHFRSEAIEAAIVNESNYTDKYFEDTIREDETEAYYNETRYEVWNIGASSTQLWLPL